MDSTGTTDTEVGRPTNTARAKDIVILAIWLGVVTGLVEGGLLLAFQQLHLLPFTVDQWSVSPEIVWIDCAFDLLLFVALGLALLGLRCFFPRLVSLRGCLFLLAWFTFFDWLTVSGRIHPLAVLILGAGLAVAAMRWFTRCESSTLRFARRTLPWVGSAALLALFGIEGGLWLGERIATARLPAVPSDSPNILVIVVDTLRADHLSTYGYARATSPNIDRIAQQGALFENAFSASSWTLPSHASLLTGRYVHEHGVGADQNHNYYDGRYPSFAESLRADGYRTGAFSANTIFFCRGFGFGRSFLHFEDYYSSLADTASRTIYGHEFDKYFRGRMGLTDFPGRKRAPEVNREFLRWVDRIPGKRFLAFLNYFDCHEPYMPPEPYRSRFAGLENLDGSDLGSMINPSTSQALSMHIPSKDLENIRNNYDGAVAYVDTQIGQLFSDLKARGLIGNTLVVITSDHGEELGDHGLFDHGESLYRQEIHVPLIFWWPGNIPSLRLGTPVTNVALPATIMDLLGRGEQSTFPGPSLAQLWKTPAAVSAWPEPLAEMAQIPRQPLTKYRIPANDGALKTLITSRWQYIVNEKVGEELYDWSEDPQELHNLAATAAGERIGQEMLMRLHALVGEPFWKHVGNMRYQSEKPEPPDPGPTPASSRLR